jgi:hypothetical protein
MKSNTFYEYNGPFYSKGIFKFKVHSTHIHLTAIRTGSIFANLENRWSLRLAVNKKEGIYE